MQPVAEQISVFLMLVVLGMAVGFIYDFYRVLRRVHGLKKRGTNIGDIIYWLIVTVITYIFLLQFLWGEVRLYVFLSMVIGLVMYIKTLSPFIYRQLFRLYNFIIKTIKTIIRLIRIPLRFICNLVSIPFRLLARFTNFALDKSIETKNSVTKKIETKAKKVKTSVNTRVKKRMEKIQANFKKKPPPDPPEDLY